MITVPEAKALIQENFSSLSTEILSLKYVLDRVVAEDVKAPIAMPPFRQSAMDGYAIRLNEADIPLRLQGVIKAGDTVVPELEVGSALRIFTGAMVPDSADVVVMQEKVEVVDNTIHIKDNNLKPQLNIRPVGEQIAAETIAIKKGTVMTSGAIGFAASLGLVALKVVCKPRIALAITGDELVKPGNSLKAGQVYESNSITIESAAEATGYRVLGVANLADDFETTKEAIQQLAKMNDVLILTGGISVGDYDFVWQSLQELGCDVFFYKVKQKPGKPMLVGQLGDCKVFALPGNPYAALSCYYQYVLTGLDLMSGKISAGMVDLHLPLTHDYLKKGDRAEFLKAKISEGKVTILGAQASSMLSAFTDANAQVYVPWEVNELKQGERVSCFLL